jgi:hypothetical protein
VLEWESKLPDKDVKVSIHEASFLPPIMALRVDIKELSQLQFFSRVNKCECSKAKCISVCPFSQTSFFIRPVQVQIVPLQVQARGT